MTPEFFTNTKDNVERVFVKVGEYKSSSPKIPPLVKLFNMSDKRTVEVMRSDLDLWIDKGIFVPFTPEIQNQTGI